ncbi:diguanylate cyclase domain-containing protein [Pararhodospirillum photometricum]|uniref:GGDEF family protein n=1 Tax=Pararhodospirillum photometricum DSM 122 TaxID=1150469 RepID=H6SPA2_PARPM|nr:diguanylate cyclase [Pararhodospirillum photometricum]CCG09427.1 GGDEF family protein [Pararhodospirillum photometricum DSM 122]
MIAEKCQAALAAPIPYKDHTLRIGLSIGSARFPTDATTAAALLAHADQAMYHAKHGRNT